jgi:methylated-DNA-[protein]-cysteine S-methyltransferase
MTDLEALLRAGPAGAEPDVLVEQFSRRASDEQLVDVAWATIDSPCGELLVAGTERGLVAVGLRDLDAMLEQLAEKVSPRVLRAPQRLDDPRRQLDEYFAGKRRRFELDLDWSMSRGFRRDVLSDLLEHVPYGEVITYGELAERANNPRAVRAVGSAMATNPLPIVVPCHRVLRTGGGLGNYGGGVEMKRWLLTMEGALLTN